MNNAGFEKTMEKLWSRCWITNCQLLINKRENTGLKYLNSSKTFIEYSNDMDDIYKI